MSSFTNEGFNVGYRAGVVAERDRIIALLEAMNGQGTVQTYVRPDGRGKPVPSSVYIDRLLAIALIKGENE